MKAQSIGNIGGSNFNTNHEASFGKFEISCLQLKINQDDPLFGFTPKYEASKY
jgi:hypothetical protein